jgi:hypothetical protein
LSKILLREKDQKAEEAIVKSKRNSIKLLGYRLFFIGQEDLEIEVMETNHLDIEEIEHRLKSGESVFIDSIAPAKIVKPEFQASKHEDVWYFSHS